jgi:hypothetical protein
VGRQHGISRAKLKVITNATTKDLDLVVRSFDHSVDVGLVLSVLTKHLHYDPAACVSSFLAAQLDNPILCLMNECRANHATPVRSEISRCVELFVNRSY